MAMMGGMGGAPGQPMDPAMLEGLMGGAAPEAEQEIPEEDPGADGEKVLIKSLDLVEKVVDLALGRDDIEEAPESAAATMLASGGADNVSPNEIMELADTVGQEPSEIPQLS
jgi:hypothetical protein